MSQRPGRCHTRAGLASTGSGGRRRRRGPRATVRSGWSGGVTALAERRVCGRTVAAGATAAGGHIGCRRTAAPARLTANRHRPRRRASGSRRRQAMSAAVGGRPVGDAWSGLRDVLAGGRPDCGGRRPHYPSWGSETPEPETSPAAASGPHYPSWGSETLARTGSASAGYVPSHTPHGDRKPDRRNVRRASARHLITPHGDRKHGGEAIDGPCHVVSLPLMGIGNPPTEEQRAVIRRDSLPLMGIGNRASRRRSAPSSRRTHYPSWGSETPYSMARPPADRPSLPLMGIGNPSSRTWNIYLSNPLITPHGDRKLSFGDCSGDSRRTHYPSWGSETPISLGLTAS